MRKTSIGFKISTVAISLLMFIFLSGFVPVVIGFKKATKFNTATVQVQADADEIYSDVTPSYKVNPVAFWITFSIFIIFIIILIYFLIQVFGGAFLGYYYLQYKLEGSYLIHLIYDLILFLPYMTS